MDVAGTKSLKNILLACVFQVLNWFLDFEVFRGSALRWPSLQALRAETMVDGLPRACRLADNSEPKIGARLGGYSRLSRAVAHRFR